MCPPATRSDASISGYSVWRRSPTLWFSYRYLYKQLLVFFDPKSREGSIFERRVGCSYLQLKPKTYLHLYSNQLPDGCAQTLNLS